MKPLHSLTAYAFAVNLPDVRYGHVRTDAYLFSKGLKTRDMQHESLKEAPQNPAQEDLRIVSPVVLQEVWVLH